jgi:hypothetical protein
VTALAPGTSRITIETNGTDTPAAAATSAKVGRRVLERDSSLVMPIPPPAADRLSVPDTA